MPANTSPLPNTLSVRALLLRPILEHFVNEPRTVKILLHRGGLSEAILEDPYCPIPLFSYLAIFEHAAQLAQDPTLGARLGLASRPGSLAPIGLRAVQAGTIRRSLEALAQYSSALQSGTEVALIEDGDHLILNYMVLAPAGMSVRQDAEFTLAGVFRLIRSTFDTRWRPVEVHFSHAAPSDRTKLDQMFGTKVLYSQSANRLVLSVAEAEHVHRSEDSDLIQMIDRHLEQLIGDTRLDVPVGDQVRALILMFMGVRPVTLESMAAALHVTPRSLQRRLGEEGLMFKRLLRTCREEKADQLLREGLHSMATISAILGYADQTAFWRAHRNWTGVSPKVRRPPGDA